MKNLKNVILAVLVSVIAIGANAQTFKKTDKILEGTVALVSAKGEKAQYAFEPTVGYFLTDKVAVGVSGLVGKNETEKIYGFGAYARCYFLNAGKNLKVYSQLGLGTTTMKEANVKVSEFTTGVGVGANYFITNKIALSAHLFDLVTYQSSEGMSVFSVGFTGVNNPITSSKFGLLIKL